jgi:serine protease Do
MEPVIIMSNQQPSRKHRLILLATAASFGAAALIIGPSGFQLNLPALSQANAAEIGQRPGVVTRGWIGVQVQPVTAEIAEILDMKGSGGALVADSQANSPAAKAGILPGDVITAVNGNSVKDARDLARQIGAMSSGSTATLTVWRNGAEKAFSVTLGELPKERDARAGALDHGTASADQPKVGLALAPAGDIAGSGSEGVVVTDVDPNGLASERGFKTGDVILEVGGKKVTSAADVRNALSEAHTNGKRAVLMRVKSDGVTTFVAVPIVRA